MNNDPKTYLHKQYMPETLDCIFFAAEVQEGNADRQIALKNEAIRENITQLAANNAALIALDGEHVSEAMIAAFVAIPYYSKKPDAFKPLPIEVLRPLIQLSQLTARMNAIGRKSDKASISDAFIDHANVIEITTSNLREAEKKQLLSAFKASAAQHYVQAFHLIHQNEYELARSIYSEGEFIMRCATQILSDGHDQDPTPLDISMNSIRGKTFKALKPYSTFDPNEFDFE